MEQKNNTGAIFKNDYKKTEAQPDYKGKAIIDENEELRADVESRHNFDHIPPEKRIKTFEVRYDKDVVKAIYDRIKECREYYKTLINGQT